MSGSTMTAEETLRRRAEELVETLRSRGPEAEELRRMPDATIADYADADFFRAMRPAEVGGLEVGLKTFVDVTRILARGDASAGWIGGFFMSHSWMLSKMGAEAQATIFGERPWVLAAAAAAPPGRARTVDGGVEITGRWRFASGIMHSEWVALMAFGDDGPLTCVVPVDAVTVHDTWQVPGMKGTGSNDVEAVDLFVPAVLAVPFDQMATPECPGAELYDYPLLRYPMHRVLPMIHPAVALGVADAAMDLFRAGVGGRVRVQSQEKVIEEPMTHETYGEAYTALRAAELLLDDALEIIDSGYGPDGTGLEVEDRAKLNLAVTAAGVKAFEAVDLLVRASGASVHRTGNPMDRLCRDTQVMRNHGVLDWRYTTAVSGRVLLGEGLGAHSAAMF